MKLVFLDNHDLFGFMYRSSDMIERFAMLRLVPDEITKEVWLEKLVTGLANATSIANRVRNLSFVYQDHFLRRINRLFIVLFPQWARFHVCLFCRHTSPCFVHEYVSLWSWSQLQALEPIVHDNEAIGASNKQYLLYGKHHFRWNGGPWLAEKHFQWCRSIM